MLLNINYNGKTIEIIESDQFTENESLIISFRNLPLEFSIEKVEKENLIPNFYYWENYGCFSRREYNIRFEKIEITISNKKPKVGEFIYGKINALTMPILLNGKMTQFEIKGKFKHHLTLKNNLHKKA